MPDRVISAPHRRRLIGRLATHIERTENPRLAVLCALTAGGTLGFLTSAGLLTLGLTTPWIRYALASLGGYGVFLGLLRAWLSWRGNDGDDDVPLDQLVPDSVDGSVSPFSGGGGFGGGGGSGDFGAAGGSVGGSDAIAEAPARAVGGGLEVLGDVDEGIVVVAPLILLGVLVVGLGATASVLYNAPVLFAEVLLDGAIATVVYRRLRRRSLDHWATGLLRRTWKPMLAVVTVLVGLGIAIPLLVPGADSIGDLFR